MSYHFIQMRPTKGFLSLIDPNKKSRFICFSDKTVAKTFINYTTHFRSEHGYWPVLDMSDKIATVKSKVNVKYRSPEELNKYIGLETFEYEDIEEMVKRTNISFICITNFSLISSGRENQMVTFSGQEWDGEADDFAYRDLLEFNLKVK